MVIGPPLDFTRTFCPTHRPKKVDCSGLLVRVRYFSSQVALTSSSKQAVAAPTLTNCDPVSARGPRRNLRGSDRPSVSRPLPYCSEQGHAIRGLAGQAMGPRDPGRRVEVAVPSSCRERVRA
jgi:hypothetical protein